MMADAVNIRGKLAAVQAELRVPKGQYNSFGKYKYRSCEDIVEAAKPLAHKHGALLLLADEVVLIGERFYVKATARFIDTGDGTEICNTAFAREEPEKKGMDGSQITGTASSYARKYALNGLLAIDDTKDADTDEHANQTQKAAKDESKRGPAPISAPCCVCGKMVDPDTTRGSKAKYGKVYCSSECKLLMGKR